MHSHVFFLTMSDFTCPSRVNDDIARRHYYPAAVLTLFLCRNARFQQDTTKVLLRLRESSTPTSKPSLLRFVARNNTDLKKQAPDDKRRNHKRETICIEDEDVCLQCDMLLCGDRLHSFSHSYFTTRNKTINSTILQARISLLWISDVNTSRIVTML